VRENTLRYTLYPKPETRDPKPGYGILSRMIRHAALLLAILVLGCGGASDKTALRVWDWWSPVEGEKMRDYFRVVEETFEREHPGGGSSAGLSSCFDHLGE